jgi:hypothetical protein
MGKNSKIKLLPATVYVVMSLLVLVLMNSLITTKPITSDAQQNLRMGYHLYKHGVISKDGEVTGKPEPTNYREPVPTIVTGLFIYLHPGINKGDSLASFEDGVNTPKVKQVNLIWLLLLQIGVGLLAFKLSGNKAVPIIAWFLVFYYFIRFGNHFDEMNTELACAVFIIWATYSLWMAIEGGSLYSYAVSGLILGLLILTKAVFFYVVPIILVCIIIYQYCTKRLQNYALLAGAVLLVITPWMIRNYSIYEDTSITQRGGSVLYQRAMINQMTAEEVPGAIYHWGPELYRTLVDLTPFAIDSSEFNPGGAYERLDRDQVGDSLATERGRPDEAISFFGKTRAEINRLQNVLGEGDLEGSRRKAFEIMQEEGMDIILDQPFKHAAMSFLFIWRGIWSFPNATIPIIKDPLQSIIHNLINLSAYVALFAYLFMGFMRKQSGLFVLSIIPVMMILFQAGVSPSLSRFNEPAIPSMIIALSILIHGLYERIVASYPQLNLIASRKEKQVS